MSENSEKKSQKKFLVLFNSEKVIMESLSKKQLKLYTLLREKILECDFDFGIALTAVIKSQKIDSYLEKNLIEVVNLFKAVHKNSDKHPVNLIETMNKINNKFIQDSCKYFTLLKQRQDISMTLPLLDYLNNTTTTQQDDYNITTESQQDDYKNTTTTQQDLNKIITTTQQDHYNNSTRSEKNGLKNQCNQDVNDPLIDIVIDNVIDTDIDIVNKKEKNKKEKVDKLKKFIKPTLEEVQAYCRERNNNVNPEQFIAYYEANGWKVGRNPMKNWRAAIVSTWERNNYNKAPPQKKFDVGEYLLEQIKLTEEQNDTKRNDEIDLVHEVSNGRFLLDKN